MMPILKNNEHEKLLRQNGFLKLNIIPIDVIKELTALYEETRIAHERVARDIRFHSTQDSGDEELSRYVDRRGKEILKDTVEKYFQDYQWLTANFIVKETGEASVLKPHQDWNFVDESQFFTFNIWIPLVDTNANNGNLQVLPGSHKLMPTIRANYNYPWAYNKVSEIIEENFVEVPTALGECVLLNHAVIHGSRANMTSTSRVTLVLAMTQKQAQLTHYFSDDGKTLETYRMSTEDIYSIRRMVRPKNGILIEKRLFNFPEISLHDFNQWLEKRSKTHSEKAVF